MKEEDEKKKNETREIITYILDGRRMINGIESKETKKKLFRLA